MSDSNYSDQDFWQKLKRYAADAGREVIETALKLYYALQDPDTPAWARTVIVGALVYFIAPADAVADLLPGGYVDDLGALVGAVWTVSAHIKDEHATRAREKLREWFNTPDIEADAGDVIDGETVEDSSSKES